MGDVEIVISNADDGREASVRQGDTVTVRLDEVPTSGYRWEIKDHDPGVLKPTGDDYQAPAETKLGGSGTRVFSFELVGTGTSRLGFVRRRPWDPDSIADSFEVTIKATE